MDEGDQVGVKIDSGFDFEAVAGKTVLRRAICKCGKESKATLRQLEDGATTSKMERTGESGAWRLKHNAEMWSFGQLDLWG